MSAQVHTLRIGDRVLELSERPVMGILNVTPDSFFDGGEYNSVEAALSQCQRMLSEGAAIIDIGANSSRPGSEPVSPERELELLDPIVRAILERHPDLFISIDTFRHQVADEMLNLGAQIINDISAGDDDPEMLNVIAHHKATYIAMHKQGSTKDMQLAPQYSDVLNEVQKYFISKVGQFEKHGITEFVIDPGFGFGKTVEHNYRLLKHLRSFSDVFRRPVLAGISRKSMINRVLGIKPQDALNGTSVLNTIALMNGADILRVHDVKEAVEVVKLVRALEGDGAAA